MQPPHARSSHRRASLRSPVCGHPRGRDRAPWRPLRRGTAQTCAEAAPVALFDTQPGHHLDPSTHARRSLGRGDLYPAVAVAALIQFPAEGEERSLAARHLDHFARGRFATCAREGALVRNKHSTQDRRRPRMDLGTSDKRLNDWRRGAAAELVPIMVRVMALHDSGPSNHFSASVAWLNHTAKTTGSALRRNAIRCIWARKMERLVVGPQIALPMSAFGGKADVRELPAVCPLIAMSRHCK